MRKTGDAAYRTAVGVALAAAFLLIWVNGAVGIIGSENNDIAALKVKYVYQTHIPKDIFSTWNVGLDGFGEDRGK